jgi:hypothetical protein
MLMSNTVKAAKLRRRQEVALPVGR